MLALLFAAAFALDGATRIVTAWHVLPELAAHHPGRCPAAGARRHRRGALAHLAGQDHPLHRRRPDHLGHRRRPGGTHAAPLAGRRHARRPSRPPAAGADLALPPVPPTPPGHALVVRVWTALGTVDPIHRPLLDRYIAAVDAKGTISTGHAALELPPDLYISHYPAVEIDHSPTDSCTCSAPRPTMTMPGRCRAMPSNRPNSARPPAASPSGATIRHGCAPSGESIGGIRPTT
ncbi:MAG: hypothetical protein U1E17_03300 [Geminicoccaceae bacterium]